MATIQIFVSRFAAKVIHAKWLTDTRIKDSKHPNTPHLQYDVYYVSLLVFSVTLDVKKN
jgi:hypothetical protein